MTCLEKPRRCYLVLALLSVIYFTPLWRHPTQLLYSKHSDVLWQHYPWRVFAVTSWHEDGELPLWCPYACGGQPFQADGQSNLFYPPHAVFYAVPESWVAPLFGLLVWAHVLLAGCGMFAYARGRGLPPVGALVAAVGFMFAGKWLVHVLQAGHYIFIPAAWFPLLLLFLEQAVERRRLGYAAAAGVCLAMLLTGAHPQLVLYSLLLAGILSLRGVFTHYQKEHAVLMAGRVQESGNACGMRARFSNLMIQRQESVHGVPRLAKSPGPLRGLGWWLLAWGVAGSLAIGLAAVQLLPTLELVTFTTRASTAAAGFDESHDLTFRTMPELARRLLSLVGPRHFSGNPWETTGNLGVLWAAAAVLALGLCRRPVVWLYGATLLLMLLVAFGNSTPVYGWLCKVVPGLSLFRNQTRVLLLAGFPLGMLAGHVTQALFDARASRRRWKWGIAALVLGLLVVAYLVPSLRQHAPGRGYAICLAITGTALIAVIVARVAWPAGAKRLAMVWIGLMLADLWALHAQFVQTRPVERIYAVNDAVRFLAEHPGSYRVLDRPPPGRPATYSPLTQALCYQHRIRWLRAQNPTDLFAYKKYLSYAADRDAAPPLGEVPVVGELRNQQLLDLLGVRYLVCPAGQPLSSNEQEHWGPVATLNDTRVHLEEDTTPGGLHRLPAFVVYERKAALPKAFAVAEARLAPPADQLLPALRNTDLYRAALLDSPPGWCDSAGEPEIGDCGGPAFQEAAIIAEKSNRLVVEVDRQTPGYLVLSEIWYPGWRCYTADGQELPVWRANGLFRAVKVPAGNHRLEFVFAPTIYRLGGAISLLTLAGLAGCTAWGTARYWRQSRRSVRAILAPTIVTSARVETLDETVRRQRHDFPLRARQR